MEIDKTIENLIIETVADLGYSSAQIFESKTSKSLRIIWSWPETNNKLSQVLSIDKISNVLEMQIPLSDAIAELDKTEMDYLKSQGITGFIILPVNFNTSEQLFLLLEEKEKKENRSAHELDKLLDLAYKIRGSQLSRSEEIKVIEIPQSIHEKYLNELINDVVMRVDRNGLILDCRGYTTTDSGFSPDEISGLNIVMFARKDDNDKTPPWESGRDVIDYVLSMPSVELTIQYRTGELHWVAVRGFPITSTSGETEYLCCLTDIHNQKMLEIKYNELKDLHNKIMNNIIDVVWIVDLETLKYTYMSPSDKRARGYDTEEAMKKDLREIMPQEYHEILMAALTVEWEKEKKGIASPDRFQKVPMIEIRKDRSTFHSEMCISAIRDKKTGKPLELIGISRNVEDQWIKEKELENQKESFKALADSIKEGLVIWEYNKTDKKLVPSFISKSVADMTGYTHKQVTRLLNSSKDLNRVFSKELVMEMEDILSDKKPMQPGKRYFKKRWFHCQSRSHYAAVFILSK